MVYNNILSVRSLEQTKLLCNVCCCCILAPSIPLPQMSGSFVIALFRLSLQLFRLLRSDNLAVALTFNAIQSNLRNFKIAVFLAHVPPNNQSGSTFLLRQNSPLFLRPWGIVMVICSGYYWHYLQINLKRDERVRFYTTSSNCDNSRATETQFLFLDEIIIS